MSIYTYETKKDTRSGFGAGMEFLSLTNPKVVALCADLIGSLKLEPFIKNCPERFFQTGIADANMIGIAAGLSIAGYVKIACSHAGLTLGEDGATHQILEDIGLMKMLPGMVVINPCDYNQTKAATIAVANYNGPVYLRFGRPVVPVFTPEDQEFVIGKAIKLIEGSDVSIFATGHLVWESILAADILKEKGIHAEVINIHTIKPLDTQAILDSVKKTNCLVSAEEHQINGGLGDSIAQFLATTMPLPQEFVGVYDSFGESGKPADLMDKYGLNAASIVQKSLKAISRK